jgi:hypothetical protein
LSRETETAREGIIALIFGIRFDLKKLMESVIALSMLMAALVVFSRKSK